MRAEAAATIAESGAANDIEADEAVWDEFCAALDALGDAFHAAGPLPVKPSA